MLWLEAITSSLLVSLCSLICLALLPLFCCEGVGRGGEGRGGKRGEERGLVLLIWRCTLVLSE